MKIAFWASRQARAILFLLAALVVGGAAGSLAMPTSLLPRINFPFIRVDVDAGDRPGERMAIEVARPIEEALRTIPGVRGVRSTTARGTSLIWANFDWGDDMNNALLQSQSQVNKLLPTLPAGTTFNVRRMDPTVFTVISYSLTTTSKRPLSELHDLAEYQLRPVLSAVPGVARVEVQGSNIEEYRVAIDPVRLQDLHLTLSEVSAAINAANILSANGRVEENDKNYLIISDTRMKSIDEIGKTILRSGPGGTVLLGDVAKIRSAPAPNYTLTTADGKDAVLFNVYQQPGGNTVAIAKGIRDALAAEQKHVPADVKITNWYDQSDLIVASAASVRDAVIIGGILAALVLLLFLRDWKITLIAAIAVPVVLAITALVLYALNQSFNMMTLGGMAAAVGLIIDDAIVMSEHIARRLHGESRRGDVQTTVLDATNEFSGPLAGSSLSTILIHIPPAFLIGVFGACFAALSLAMATSLVISFFVSWMVIPVIAASWLGVRDARPAGSGTAAKPKGRIYGPLMRGWLGHPWIVLLVAAPLLFLGYEGYSRAPSGFMPVMDEGGFVLDYVAPPGASLAETDRLLKQVEEILHATPEVETWSRRTGYSLGGDLSESYNGDFFIRLKPFPRRAINDVKEEVEKKVAEGVPGLDIETALLTQDLIGDLSGGSPQPIIINLYSDQEKVLPALAKKVTDALKDPATAVKGVVEVKSTVRPSGDGLNIEINRIKAAQEGVDPDALNKSLTDLLSGSVATQIQHGPKIVNVRLWIPQAVRKNKKEIGTLQLRAPDGHYFPLSRVADFNLIPGQPEISRENLRRMVAVTARIEGRDLGATAGDVKKMLETPGFLPAGVRFTLGGTYAEQQASDRATMQVILAAGALVFLLLLFMYRSFRVAICILLTTLLAIAVVFVALWLTHTERNISSLMGMVMIVGNVTEVAIFYYSEFADTAREGSRIDRLVAAGTYRMRAIVMTTTAAILALLPLALGIGQGSGMLQPLAIAIIAGLVAQLPLVLVVLPGLLMLAGKDAEMAK